MPDVLPGGFKPNGFPINDLTHDGTIMAYDIGARVTGKEWNDGHPGQSTNAAACFDGWHGMFERKCSTTGVGIRHDLGVDLNYSAYKNGNPVQMGRPSSGSNADQSGPYRPVLNQSQEGPGGRKRPEGPAPGEGPRGKRPSDYGPGGEGGAPPGMGGTTVGGSSAGMSIHKSEGLVPINDQCESDIPGLVKISAAKIQNIQDEIFAPLKREAGYSPAWVTQTLQGIMIPNFVLYIKKERLMQAALAYIEELRDHHAPMLRAADLHELRLAHETKNMILNA